MRLHLLLYYRFFQKNNVFFLVYLSFRQKLENENEVHFLSIKLFVALYGAGMKLKIHFFIDLLFFYVINQKENEMVIGTSIGHVRRVCFFVIVLNQ